MQVDYMVTLIYNNLIIYNLYLNEKGIKLCGCDIVQLFAYYNSTNNMQDVGRSNKIFPTDNI